MRETESASEIDDKLVQNLPRIFGKTERRQSIQLRHQLGNLLFGAVAVLKSRAFEQKNMNYFDERRQFVAAQIEHFQISNCATLKRRRKNLQNEVG